MQTWKPRWNQLAAAGKRFEVVTSPWMGWTSATTGCHGTCLSGYQAAVGLAAGSIDAYEGPNECDDHGITCTDWGTKSTSETPQFVVAHWTPLVWNLRSSSVTVYGPGMAFPNGYSEFTNLAGYMHAGAIHNYTKPDMPETSGRCCSYLSWKIGAAYVSGSDPLASTETGYNTDPTFANGGVSKLAQERYIPRLLFTDLQNNVKHTYLYALLDYPAGSGTGQDFGLLNPDYTPKPAWTRLMQLMSYFADSGTSPQNLLTFTLSGDATGALHMVLFQKSNGTYILVPWLATLIWNSTSHVDTAVTNETITLTLPSTVKSVTLTRFGDYGKQVVSTLSGSVGKFSLPVSSLVEAVSFHT